MSAAGGGDQRGLRGLREPEYQAGERGWRSATHAGTAAGATGHLPPLSRAAVVLLMSPTPLWSSLSFGVTMGKSCTSLTFLFSCYNLPLIWIHTLQEQLRAEGAAVQSELVALEEGLGRRAAVAASRSILELMQNIAHVMSKVSTQLRWPYPRSSTLLYDLLILPESSAGHRLLTITAP